RQSGRSLIRPSIFFDAGLAAVFLVDFDRVGFAFALVLVANVFTPSRSIAPPAGGMVSWILSNGRFGLQLRAAAVPGPALFGAGSGTWAVRNTPSRTVSHTNLMSEISGSRSCTSGITVTGSS